MGSGDRDDGKVIVYKSDRNTKIIFHIKDILLQVSSIIGAQLKCHHDVQLDETPMLHSETAP